MTLRASVLARIVAFFSLALAAALLGGCGSKTRGEAPTPQVVERVLKSSWDKPAGSFNPKSELTLNSVKFGKPYAATAQEVQVEGVPAGATVTPAIVDFTVRTYYTGETQALRRVREASVYKDKMDEWAVMTGSVKGQDVTTMEPAKK